MACVSLAPSGPNWTPIPRSLVHRTVPDKSIALAVAGEGEADADGRSNGGGAVGFDEQPAERDVLGLAADRLPRVPGRELHRHPERDAMKATLAHRFIVAGCAPEAPLLKSPVEDSGYPNRPPGRVTPSHDSRASSPYTASPVTPKRHTPPEQPAVCDDNLEGPTSAVRPHVPLFAVPWPAMTLDGLRCLPLDARAAYILSLVDGSCTVETLLDVYQPQVARDEALDILAHLLELGAIELRDP